MHSQKPLLRRAVEEQWVRFILVSVIGTFFSFPLYLFLRYHGLSKYVASPISNLVAQAIDFFPHKFLSFGEKKLDGKVVTIEASMYGAVAFILVFVEPALLDVAEHQGLSAFWAWIAVHPFTGATRFLLYRWIFRKFHNHTSPSS